MEKLKNNLGPILMFIALLIGITVAATDCSSNAKNVEESIEYGLPKPHEIADTVLLEPFSEESLINKINREGILYTRIVMAQAKLETGNFKSNVFKQNNNLFGFVGRNGYIKYTSWQKSVEDYKRWQTKYYKRGDYYAFLDRIGYATDTSYTDKLKRMN